jgi:DNA-binding IclR family transcriptional regulator
MKHSLKIAERSARRRTVPEGAASTETLDLALRLLEQLASSGDPIGVSELAREFGSSKATVYRHLRTLARHGFVHQDRAKRYAAGIKLFILGERLRERFGVLPVARPELTRLRDETGQPATLSAVVESTVVILEVVQGPAIVNFGTQPGTELDFHASAHGKVALAFGPKGLMERCLARGLKAWTPHTICSPSALERGVAQVRSRGWATAPNQTLQGVNGVAAPIFNHAGEFAGSVSIGGSIQYIPASPSELQIKAVTQTAQRISRQLGWTEK